jgi:hypothetical protein
MHNVHLYFLTSSIQHRIPSKFKGSKKKSIKVFCFFFLLDFYFIWISLFNMRSILFITFAISCLIGSNLALPTKRADKPVEKIGHIAEKVDAKVDAKVENEVKHIKRDLPFVGDLPGSLPGIGGGGLGLGDSEPSGDQAPNQSQTDGYTDVPSDKSSLKQGDILSRKMKRGSGSPLDGLPVSSLTSGGLPVVDGITKGGLPTGALSGLPIPGTGPKGGLPDLGGITGGLPLPPLGGSGEEAEEPAPEKPAPKKPAPQSPADQAAAKKAHGTAKKTGTTASDAATDVADDTTAAK